MGASKKIKNIFVKPYKAFTNKFIPIVNTINNYLDSWFPSEKYNWRKIAIGWGILQAVIITSLEIYVAYLNLKQVRSIYEFYKHNNDSVTMRKLNGVDSLAVYHMIFIVAQFFLFYLVCDTVSKSSSIQLIISTFFSIGIAGYSVIQLWQANKSAARDENDKENKSIINHYIEGKGDDLHLHEGKTIEYIIIGLMVIFCLGWILIALRLYKIFGWNVFKQLGADIGVKNRLKLCQIFLAMLKIDIFFFTAFTIQIFIFVVTNLTDSNIKSINCALLVVNFVILFLGFYAIKKENYAYMSMFILLLSVSIGYMVYNVVDVVYDGYNQEKNNAASGNSTKDDSEIKYRNCSISLSMACYSSIISGMITFILAIVNFKNFPKGLRKDKTLRPTSTHNSTLSSSYNTGKRWSIE